MSKQQLEAINGIDTDALKQVIEEVSQDPAKGMVRFEVANTWQGGTKSEARVESWHLGGEKLPRQFNFSIDEPSELLGNNTAPNPQEMLMAALNACMMVGYVAGCALKGIELERLEIRSEGGLDLRGFLGLDEAVKPGYDEIRYSVHIKGSGTPEQFQEIHENVMVTSPNYWNMANPIKLRAKLILD
jgi:uncharacterized OsmC-like protein